MTCTCAGVAPGYPQHEDWCGRPESEDDERGSIVYAENADTYVGMVEQTALAVRVTETDEFGLWFVGLDGDHETYVKLSPTDARRLALFITRTVRQWPPALLNEARQ
jgi:hypothetical protein